MSMASAKAKPHWDLGSYFLGAAFLAPAVVVVLQVAWAALMNRVYPDWFLRAHVDHLPAPFLAAEFPDIVGGLLLIGAVLILCFLVRKGHGWLAVILCGYYAAAFVVMCLGMFLVSGGVVP